MSDDEEMDYGMDDLLGFMDEDNAPPHHVAVAEPVPATSAIQVKRERVPVIEPTRGHVLPERSPAKQVKRKAPAPAAAAAESEEDADIRAKIKALEAQLLRRQRPAGGKAPPKPKPTPPPTLVPPSSSSLTSTTGTTQNEHNRVVKRPRSEHTSVALSTQPKAPSIDVTEVYSGLSIRKRTVSSTELRNKMTGKTFLKIPQIAARRGKDDMGDFVTIGVLSSKSATKQSAKGENYSIWSLSDLNRGEVSLFLFGSVFTKHWKETEGCVVGLLNPSIMPVKEGAKYQASVSLSIDVPGQLMKLGVATDYGICKGTRKDGHKCTMAINQKLGDYCEYHVQAVHSKFRNGRMALQAPGSHTPTVRPGAGKKKAGTLSGMRAQLTRRGFATNQNPTKRTLPSAETIASQSKRSHFSTAMRTLDAKGKAPAERRSGSFGPRAGEAEDPVVLQGGTKGPRPKGLQNISNANPRAAEDAARSMAAAKLLDVKRGGKNRPLLGRGLAIKANITVEQTLGHLSAKARATELIKMTGGIAKQERNVTLIRPTVAVVGASQAPSSSKSRLETAASSATKKRPQLAMATGMGIDLDSEEGRRLLETRSKNAGALDTERDEAREKRWARQVQQEKMGEKMDAISEQTVSAYKCAQCSKITQMKPDQCYKQHHNVSKVKSIKRWFTCDYCSRHISATGQKMYASICSGCHKRPPSWSRGTMRRQNSKSSAKKTLPSAGLELTGGKSKWINSL